MKKNFLLLAVFTAISVVTYTSCNKVASLIKAASIDWSGVDVTIDVPITTDTANNTSIGTGTFTYNLDSMIKAQTSNQLGLSNIDQFYLTGCTITLSNADADNNFGNFQSASATFSTSAKTTPTNLGSISNNPSDFASTITLPVNTTENLKPYISPTGTTTFFYNASGKLRKGTNKILNATIHVTYSIHVTP